MNVLKDKRATDLYGEEGKDGVIEITTRDPITKAINENADIMVTGYGQQLNSPLPVDGVKIRTITGGKPLIIVNGIVRDIELNTISPNQIESISVKKNAPSATALYGEKAKDGVIIITLKRGVNSEDLNQKETPAPGKDAFFVVEEMPAFPGGDKALQSYIYSHINVVKGSEKISEPVLVVFTVDNKGKVRDAQVLKKKYPVWEAEAIRVVSSMPDWKPGRQHGMPVDVMMQLPIDFSTEKK